MGAAQSVPVVGEVVTAIDSGVKLYSAGYWSAVGAITNDLDAKETGKKFLEDAGKTWVEYSERNLIAAPVRTTVHLLRDNDKEAERVLKKMGKSIEQVIDSTPVLGHAKGVVHYIAGDTEHGHECMKGATRSLAVVGAGAVTGGLGAGFAVGGLAGVTAGVTYDGVVTAVESEVRNEARPYGTIASVNQVIESGKKEDLYGFFNSTVNVLYSVTGDFVTGGTAAQGVKKLNKASKQRNAMRDKIGNEATKDVIDTAKHLEKTKKGMKGDNHVCTKVKDLNTGKEAYGTNKRLAEQIRVKEYETKGPASGFTSKTNARKCAFKGDVGLLEKAAKEKGLVIEPKCKISETNQSLRSIDACAEHQAIDRLGTHGAETNIRTTTVKCENGSITALKTCDNCAQFVDLLGDKSTNAIDGMPVPTRQFTLDASWSAVGDAAPYAAAAIVICAYCGEGDECSCEN